MLKIVAKLTASQYVQKIAYMELALHPISVFAKLVMEDLTVIFLVRKVCGAGSAKINASAKIIPHVIRLMENACAHEVGQALTVKTNVKIRLMA